VEINELTGEARVPAIACALDCGVAINLAGVIAQAEGGIAQGLGYGLMEEHRLIGAVPQTRSLETYLIPTSEDVPVMDVVLVEGNEPTGPFGAKGIAEVVLCPTAPALGGAIRDAVEVDLDRPPATPEHLYRSLKEVRS
jgi:CO/xanthine dehydrogenase Mo-binding subunit